MANIVVTVLSVTIGLFFILVGSLKLSPVINEEVYKEMRKGFIRFAKVFPLSDLTGWKPSAHTYRHVVGVVEVVCGVVLAFVPGVLKQVANVVLLLILAGAIYTHYLVGDSLDKMTSALIFSLLLICRFIVRLQVQAREGRVAEGCKRRGAAGVISPPVHTCHGEQHTDTAANADEAQAGYTERSTAGKSAKKCD